MRRHTLDETIYAILDEDGMPKYIGRTKDMQSRLTQHWATRNCGKSAVSNWLATLNKKPDIICLEEYVWELGSNAGDRERYWIERYRYLGVNLINVWPYEKGQHPIKLKAEKKLETALDAIEKERG